MFKIFYIPSTRKLAAFSRHRFPFLANFGTKITGFASFPYISKSFIKSKKKFKFFFFFIPPAFCKISSNNVFCSCCGSGLFDKNYKNIFILINFFWYFGFGSSEIRFFNSPSTNLNDFFYFLLQINFK